MIDARQQLLEFAADRPLAHEALFEGPRHKHKRAPFHRELILDFHSPIRFLCWIVFRGGAKSTIAEEGVSILGGLREFRHAFIIGASLEKAMERLHAVRRIVEKNAYYRSVFGDIRGRPWADDHLETNTGITIVAMGRGQAIRGTKNEDFRPDLIVVDDIEDRQSISTPEGRKKVSDWFFDELLPAGDADMRVRMLANDMHPECIANELERPGSDFVVKRYPWEYRDPATGERKASWPDRFPLEEIDRTQRRYFSQGKADEYNANYMCRSRAPEDKPFRRDMFRYAGRDGVPAIARTWQAIYAMMDPARSVRATAATTGFAAWSRISGKLIVWDAWAKRMLPSEMIDFLFAFNAEYRPTKIGFEKTGLNEWAMQPIRQEQARRRIMLPMEAIEAPRGKIDFIRGLQWGFIAGETVFANESMHDLENQLLGFPSGYIDAPNALAYAQTLGAGQPVYEDFTLDHVRPEVTVGDGAFWLALNAGGSYTTGMLVQAAEGGLKIIYDWVREGDPQDLVPDIVREANLECRRPPNLCAGPQHWDRYANLGLVQACRRLPAEIRRAGLPSSGRHELGVLLRRVSRGVPAVALSGEARWTVNALAGGYCREVRNGQVMVDAEDGPYKVLCEGLESFLAMMHSVAPDQAGLTNATAGDGRKFFSALPKRRNAQEG